MAVNINVPSQVKTYANLAAFPATGALKTIYIAEDTNKTYRWTGSVYVEVSASASGITIGSTAIASGVVGRVLFEGAGNVVQESSSLFWDNTNVRLGVGTSSPAEKLDIHNQGKLRLGTSNTSFFSTINTDDAEGLVINTNYVKTSIRFSGSAVADFKSTGIHLPAAKKIFGESNFAFLDLVEGGSANTKLWNYYAYNIILGTNNAERLRLTSNGNVLINTTTDAGFRLDVNGTARVKTTDTSTPLNIAHSGSVGIQIEANANGYRMRLASTSTFSDISTPDSYLTLNQSGQRVVIGSSTIYNSAQLAVDSTTRGFLPPRMTTTQKNAIATPAAGLMVYDTTLNVISYYNGSMWI